MIFVGNSLTFFLSVLAKFVCNVVQKYLKKMFLTLRESEIALGSSFYRNNLFSLTANVTRKSGNCQKLDLTKKLLSTEKSWTKKVKIIIFTK